MGRSPRGGNIEWYKKRSGRLKRELALLARVYPAVEIAFDKGLLFLKLRVRGRKVLYLLRVVYPEDFPYEGPRAYVDEPIIEESPHRWRDGSLCFLGDVEPPNLSGKIVLDWSIAWLRIFENWLDTGSWPETVRGSSCD